MPRSLLVSASCARNRSLSSASAFSDWATSRISVGPATGARAPWSPAVSRRRIATKPRIGPVTPRMIASAATSPSRAATVANTLATVTALSTACAPLDTAAALSASSRACSRSLAR